MDRIYGLDLFSGIGGISLALEPWVKTIAYCERDRFAQSVLLSRMAQGELHKAPIWDDVRTLDQTSLAMILSLQKEREDMAGTLKKLTQEQVDLACKWYEEGSSLADLDSASLQGKECCQHQWRGTGKAQWQRVATL